MDIQQQKKYKILLIGDSCIDEYHYGSTDRISPEAPVPVFQYKNTKTNPGMAANVRQNLLAFNCDVDFITNEEKIVKSRYIDYRSGQHLIRVDKENKVQSCNKTFENLNYDAVVISDYDKGFVTEELIINIRNLFQGPIFVDTKKLYLDKFEGCILKINTLEYNRAKTFCSDLIVTQGKKGATYKGKNYPAPVVEVHDVCGAGDTFLSVLAYSYLNCKNIEQSIMHANNAAALSVQHSGVYVLTQEDLKQI
jgi:D-beta-D-heptose 7-phosphate kinase/D-beta-D-heptose 1-phosphate adenosyltransferase